MKILTSEQIRLVDAYTIKHESITSLELMERAAQECTDWLLRKFSESETFTIVCGNGNNGGDGLAIARLLAGEKRYVQVVTLNLAKNSSPDFESNLVSLNKLGIQVIEYNQDSVFTALGTGNIIIDSIVGTGLNRPLEGLARKIVDEINDYVGVKVAIDVASGLYANKPLEKNSVVLKANYTLGFELPKLVFLLPENQQYVGKWEVLPIGLNSEFISQQDSTFELLEKHELRSYLKERSKFSHKGLFGHAKLVCGSYGKMGAAILASRACLRSGVGLLTTIIPTEGYVILQQSVPEAMVECYGNRELEGEIMLGDNILGIGPGIGKSFVTRETVSHILQNAKSKLVLDADALNILADNKSWLSYIPEGSILTPHPKEFERLVGEWSNDYEKLEKLKDLSAKLSCIIILKGAYTAVGTPAKQVYFNTTGNAGMATGGSGDVLTGIITSFLAQGYSSLQAAQLGVYLHGLAGDFAAKKHEEEAMIAGDIIDFLGEAFAEIKK